MKTRMFGGISAMGVALSLAIVGVTAFTPQAPGADKPTDKRAESRPEAHAGAAAIPEPLDQLKLSAKQQDQIREIVRDYDESLNLTWKQFSDRYMQAIAMESALLAAIEDNLTDSQRTIAREARRKTARHEKAVAATNGKPNQAKVTPNEDTTKPATSAEAGLAAVEVSLTDEQEDAADKIQEKYRSRMRSLNRDIEGLHLRLVSLEADKLVEIEKVLTKEQLAQLRVIRQRGPVVAKGPVADADRTKPE